MEPGSAGLRLLNSVRMEPGSAGGLRPLNYVRMDPGSAGLRPLNSVRMEPGFTDALVPLQLKWMLKSEDRIKFAC